MVTLALNELITIDALKIIVWRHFTTTNTKKCQYFLKFCRGSSLRLTRTANTTIVENKKEIAAAAIFFTGSCITIFANVVIIALILWKRQLWHVRFYIISNLAVSDIMTLLMLASIFVRRIFQEYHLALDTKVNTSFIVQRVIGLASHISSLLT